jgi:hypothetical protein
MEFQVQIAGTPSIANKFTIEGENLLDAVKREFDSLIKKCTFHHVPFRFPMTVTPAYNKGILGGQGGIELKLEWMYSDHLDKPETLRTHAVWIYAQESALEDTTPFVILKK